MNKISLIFITLLLNSTIWASEGRETYKEKAFLGIAHSVIDTTPFKQNTAGFGYLVERVINNTAADMIGLEAGDIIIAIDDEDLSIIKKKSRREFLMKFIRNKQMGDKLFLRVLRKKQFITVNDTVEIDDIAQLKSIIDRQSVDSELDFRIKNSIDQLELTAVLGTRSTISENEVQDNKALFPEYESLTTPFTQLALKRIQDNDLIEPYENLLQRFEKDERWDNGFRLNLIRYLHRAPLKLTPIIDERMNEVQQVNSKDNLADSIEYFANWLDLSLPLNQPSDSFTYPSSTELAEHKTFIQKILNHAEKLRKQAFAKLTTEEIVFLKKETPLLIQRFEKSFYIERPSIKKDKENNTKVVELAKKVDFISLFKSAQTLSTLLNEQWLSTLKSSLVNNTSVSINTEAGKVVIGGFGNNHYSGKTALIIDFEGDDIYQGEAGSVENAISLTIDLAGNDEYQHSRKYAQGSAFMGVGILFDQQGNDVYVADSYSQGFSLFGVGILLDKAGNDRYFANHLTQAATFWGLALLLDQSGNDSYHANYYAQGVGGTQGLAALIDNSGDDHYFATGERESSYGVSGIFLGASQGVGIGFRGYSSGGIGLLLDSAGADEFRAGNFSQGVGYFFGLGILKSSGNGDDHYRASRYSQGASAHSAMGILIDEGGNDRYFSLNAVSQSAAWDLSLASLWDKAGNDHYQGSNAFASQNGFSLFIDESGDDQYHTLLNGQGNEYHGGSSFGIFIDAAGEDHYLSKSNEKDGFGNNKSLIKDEYRLFTDFDNTH